MVQDRSRQHALCKRSHWIIIVSDEACYCVHMLIYFLEHVVPELGTQMDNTAVDHTFSPNLPTQRAYYYILLNRI